MRLAVLLCGVLSGVIALGFGWWGQADALLHVAGLADAVRLAVALAIQPIALASIVGGAAILVFPAISRATLLASAVGWLALVAILGGGISLPVSVLILLTAAGGLLGFLPNLQQPMFQLQRADALADEEEAEEAEELEVEPLPPLRRAALRYDEEEESVAELAPVPVPPQQWQAPQPAPVYQPARLPAEPVPPAPPAPVYQPALLPAEPPAPVPVYQGSAFSAADLQKALEAMRPQPPEPATLQAPQPPATPGQLRLKPKLTFSKPAMMEAPALALPPQVPVELPELPESFQAEPLPAPELPAELPEPEVLPTLGNVVPPLGGDPAWQVYFPPPELAEPVPIKPPEIGPAAFVPHIGPDGEDHSQPFVPSPDDLRDVPVRAVPPVTPAPAVRRRKDEAPRKLRRDDDAPPSRRPRPKQRSKAARRRTAVGIGALALVIIGAPVLLVVDAQMRGGDAKALPAAVDTPSPAASAPSAEPKRKVSDARLPKGGPLVPVDLGSGLVSSSAPAATVAALPAAKGPPYASPFDYCAAVGNIDAPDATKITGGMPAAMVTTARNAAGHSDGDFRWRCMDKAVWVCVAAKGAPDCKPVPNAVDRGLFCAAHPDVQVTNSAAGDWSCDGFTPVVSKALLSAIDRRGFDRNAWRQLLAPVSGAG